VFLVFADKEAVMTSPAFAVEYPARRLVVSLPQPYGEAREKYEKLVPQADLARFLQAETWGDAIEMAESNAPHGFMRYYRGDITAVMSQSGSPWNATQYLMGNHIIAAHMFRHDPAVMLNAPLRTLIYTDTYGDTKFGVDQPRVLFESYHKPPITAIGQELDALLAEIIGLLGGEVPVQLMVTHP
jgi:hypothetical protein